MQSSLRRRVLLFIFVVLLGQLWLVAQEPTGSTEVPLSNQSGYSQERLYRDWTPRLIPRVESPEKTYGAAAFPSICDKTNCAGQLRAITPETVMPLWSGDMAWWVCLLHGQSYP